ncbi:hypothetical protein Tco_0836380 [Tanacetum coccineum]
MSISSLEGSLRNVFLSEPSVDDNLTLGRFSSRHSTLEVGQINHQFLGADNGSSPLVYLITQITLSSSEGANRLRCPVLQVLALRYQHQFGITLVEFGGRPESSEENLQESLELLVCPQVASSPTCLQPLLQEWQDTLLGNTSDTLGLLPKPNPYPIIASKLPSSTGQLKFMLNWWLLLLLLAGRDSTVPWSLHGQPLIAVTALWVDKDLLDCITLGTLRFIRNGVMVSCHYCCSSARAWPVFCLLFVVLIVLGRSSFFLFLSACHGMSCFSSSGLNMGIPPCKSIILQSASREFDLTSCWAIAKLNTGIHILNHQVRSETPSCPLKSKGLHFKKFRVKAFASSLGWPWVIEPLLL